MSTNAAMAITINHDTTVIPGRVRDAFANNSSFSALSNPMNVGVHVRLTLSASGAITVPVWTFSGTCDPIKDYWISSCAGLGQGFLAECEEMALTATDKMQTELDYYYTDTGTCTVTILALVDGFAESDNITFNVMRYDKAEIFYITGPGGICDDIPNEDRDNILGQHWHWHRNVEGGTLAANRDEFLRFHRRLIAKFNCWRGIFGYDCIKPYVTGEDGVNVPTGTEIDHTGSACASSECPVLNGSGDGIVNLQRHTGNYGDIEALDNYSVNTKKVRINGTSCGLAAIPNLHTMSSYIYSYHGTHHGRLCSFGDMALPWRTPADPIFWRFHSMFSELMALWQLLQLDGGSMTKEATSVDVGGEYAFVYYPDPDVTVIPACSSPIPDPCTPPSGSKFYVGTNPVTCTATDVVLLTPDTPNDVCTIGPGDTQSVTFDVIVTSPVRCSTLACTSVGCNTVSSETVLPPDQEPFEVFVSLETTCGTSFMKGCESFFKNTIDGEFMTKEEKCKALADAISNNPECTYTAAYVVVETCDVDRTFFVTDPSCPGSVLSLGISNDKKVFNQTGAGDPIPDYEAEVITPGCTTTAELVAMEVDITLAGAANGVPIVELEPSHVEFIVKLPARVCVGGEAKGAACETDVDCFPEGVCVGGPTLLEVEINTAPGQSVENIVSMAETQLRQLLTPFGATVRTTSSGRSLRIRGPLGVLPIGAGFGSADEGITSAVTVGPADMLPVSQTTVPVAPDLGGSHAAIDPPCGSCPPGLHWIDTCIPEAGDDIMPTSAELGIDLDLDGKIDTNLTLFGPVNIYRQNPLDDSLHFPGLAEVDGHFDVIDTEIVAMTLTAGDATLTVVEEQPPSLGAIVEQPTNPELGDAFFDVYFKFDPGGGAPPLYNQEAVRVSSVIECAAPKTHFVFDEPGGLIQLFTSPTPGEGEHVANLVSVDHETYLPLPDPHNTADGTSINFGSQDVPAIPADFFFPGSEVFVGTVQLTGNAADLSDTLVQRSIPVIFPPGPDFPKTSDAIQIEIIALNLTAPDPITVNPGGEQWSVQLELSNSPSGSGQLDATLEHFNGGTYDATLSVLPKITFTRLGDPPTVSVLDYGAIPIPPVQINFSAVPFVIQLEEPVLGTIVAPSNGNFVPAVLETDPGDPTTQTAVQAFGMSDAGGVGHPVQPPTFPACCVGETCIIATKLDCAAQGGTFLGDGDQPIFTCEPGVCSQGSCCLDGQCFDDEFLDTLAECEGADGVYLGGVDCDSDPCPACPYNTPSNCQQVQTIIGPMPLMDRNPANGSPDGSFGTVLADDVKFGGSAVDQICWNTGFFATPCCDTGCAQNIDDSWEIRIYDQNPKCDGLPGFELGMSTITVLNKVEGSGLATATWQYSGSVDTPIALPNGGLAGDTYWFEVSAFGDPGCEVRAIWSRDHGNEHCVEAQIALENDPRVYGLDGIRKVDVGFCENSGIGRPPVVLGSCCTDPENCVDDVTQRECCDIGGVWLACATCAETTCPQIPPDPHITLQGTSATFGAPDVPAIPADFFFPGSPSFGETVNLVGGPTDTLGQRSGAIVCPGGGFPRDCNQVSVELVQLDLVSADPITVGATQWDVAVSLSPTGSPPLGTIDATLTHANGGSYDANIPFSPRFTFTEAGNPGNMKVVDYGLDGVPPIILNFLNVNWVVVLGPGLVDTIVAPNDGNFVPGVRENIPGDPTSQKVIQSLGESMGGGIDHPVQPPGPPGADLKPLKRADAPHNILKNRTISVDPRGVDSDNPSNLHIKVEVDSSEVIGLTGSGPWWASDPVDGGGLSPAVCMSIVTTTKPASAPDWSACGGAVHLTGCPIVPTTTYSIVAESVDGDVSEPVLLDTQARPGVKWHGDCVGFFDGAVWTPPNSTTSIDDAVAGIKTFQDPTKTAGCGSPPCNATHLSVTDVHPNLNGDQMNLIVNIGDVFVIILGFQGLEYPGSDLTQCP